LFKIKNKSLFLIILLSILSIIGLLFPFDNIQYNFLTNPIVWEFCLGVLIARIYRLGIKSKYIQEILLLTGIISYFLMMLYGSGVNFEARASGYDNLIRFLFWGVPSGFIVFGLVFIEKKYSYFNNRFILLLGNASFAIYLIHTIFISLVNKFFLVIKFIPLDLVIIFSVIISAILGILYYLTIEKKLSKYFNQLFF
jgi:hypothetical protein